MAIKRARESFAYWDSNGVPHDVPAGSLIDSDKAPQVYKGKEHLFEDVDVFVEQQEKKAEGYKAESTKKMESATAAPGEKRSLTSPVPTPPKSTSRTAKDVTKDG